MKKAFLPRCREELNSPSNWTPYNLEYRGVRCVWVDWENELFVFDIKGKETVYKQPHRIESSADTDHIRMVIELYLDEATQKALNRKNVDDGNSASLHEIRVKVEGGYLVAWANQDSEYPGIDVEFRPDSCSCSTFPRILMEKPVGQKLRALIWEDPESEDFTKEVTFKE